MTTTAQQLQQQQQCYEQLVNNKPTKAATATATGDFALGTEIESRKSSFCQLDLFWPFNSNERTLEISVFNIHQKYTLQVLLSCRPTSSLLCFHS